MSESALGLSFACALQRGWADSTFAMAEKPCKGFAGVSAADEKAHDKPGDMKPVSERKACPSNAEQKSESHAPATVSAPLGTVRLIHVRTPSKLTGLTCSPDFHALFLSFVL